MVLTLPLRNAGPCRCGKVPRALRVPPIPRAPLQAVQSGVPIHLRHEPCQELIQLGRRVVVGDGRGGTADPATPPLFSGLGSAVDVQQEIAQLCIGKYAPCAPRIERLVQVGPYPVPRGTALTIWFSRARTLARAAREGWKR